MWTMDFNSTPHLVKELEVVVSERKEWNRNPQHHQTKQAPKERRVLSFQAGHSPDHLFWEGSAAFFG